MRKGRTVIGQDVYSLADGRRVHSVKDLVVSEDHDSIVALLVDEGGLLGTSTIVPIEAVHRFGPHAVMVTDSSSVIPASADDRVAATLDRKASLLGTAVVTSEGERVGSIGDMYFDEATGEILGYEVSGGTLGDVMRGTSWLPLQAISVIGPDAVIATPDATAIVESQVGGVTATLDSAREQAATATHDLADRARETAGNLSEAASQASGGGDAESDPDAVLIGRRATADVTDPSGAIVVANGQRIGREHIERARAEDGLDALYQSAGVERPVPASEQLSSAARSAAESASDLWTRFTTRLSEMTDSAGRRVDAQQTQGQLDRIHDAIGRPVTKVFLDRDDNVILNLGDLITHQAVQRAYEAGMLDSLLASVYKSTEVTFTQDQLKARVQGDSTIERASGGAAVVDELESHIAEVQASDQTDPTDQQSDGDQQPAGDQPTDATASTDASQAATQSPSQPERPTPSSDRPIAVTSDQPLSAGASMGGTAMTDGGAPSDDELVTQDQTPVDDQALAETSREGDGPR